MVKRLFFELSYLRRPPWDTHISPPELLSFLAAHPPGKALDLGCGTGTNLITLARSGWQSTGIDFSFLAIRAAKKRLRAAGLDATVRQSDVAHLGWLTGSFDLILDIGCYHSLDEVSRALYRQNLLRLLSPGGAYLIYAHFSENLPNPRGITEQDIAAFSMDLLLTSRQTGTDPGGKASTWLCFRRFYPAENLPISS